MECIMTSRTPLILHPESTSDWVEQQHEQLRWSQPKALARTTTTTTVTNKKKTSSQRTLLHIPGSAASSGPLRIEKYKTPTKTPTKAVHEWEALLQSSLASLQQAYASLDTPPPAPPRRRRSRSPTEPAPDCDRAGMASRALQAAAGCGGCSHQFSYHAAAEQPPASEGASDDVSTSASEEASDEDMPATPPEVPSADMMDLDPRLFS